MCITSPVKTILRSRLKVTLACVPVINDVIQQFCLSKVVCDLLSQPCMIKYMYHMVSVLALHCFHTDLLARIA